MTYQSPFEEMFAEYGAKSIPEPQLRAQMRRDREPSELEKKLLEKQRLSARYRKWKTQEARETLASEPRLRDFNRYLRRVKPEEGDELIEAIAESWLPACPQPVRVYALRMIDRHCNRINQRLGNDILDDPLPPETTVYFKARALLHAGGRA
jgi:hypothetical protein